VHFVVELEWIPLIYSHLYLNAWYAMVLDRLKRRNLLKNVFSALGQDETLLAPGYHVLFVVEKEIFTSKAAQNVFNAKGKENQVTACHAPDAEAKDLIDNYNRQLKMSIAI